VEPTRLYLANLVAALLVILLAGLLARRRYHLCRSFVVYVALVLAGDRLIVTWPETFDVASFWLLKESIYWGLKLAITTEIGLLTFARLPRARRILALLIAVLALAAIAAQLAPAPALAGDVIPWLSAVSPRGQVSILVVMAAVLALAAYYRVPLHPFHRSILVGLSLYLVAYTGALTLLRESGASGYRTFLALDPAAYAATVGAWAWAAWRRAPAPSPGARVLQPWATSSW
jgi:hypothetical protein